MIRHVCQPRRDFQQIVCKQGLIYHVNADGSPYWKEDSYYSFTVREINSLYETARDLHQMFLAAAEHILKTKDGLSSLEIPESLHPIIRDTWESDEWELYGRFDLTFDTMGTPKLIEYNADTPTGLLEASIIQWHWKEECFPKSDQFNSIHEGLVTRWNELIAHKQIRREMTHFTSVENCVEDRMTVGYLAATAEKAGIPVHFLPIKQIGWRSKPGEFVDEENRPIRQLFKLYPWEWMGEETFAPHLAQSRWNVLEPSWKTIFASKKLLLTLQELFPNHPHLLRVSGDPLRGDYVRKPVFGREGANVTLYKKGVEADARAGDSRISSFIYQEYCPLIRPKPGIFAQCGVWMTGPEPVGLGIRQDVRPILSNTSQFVPHIIL
jgi:glutathionylspermidine synthase